MSNTNTARQIVVSTYTIRESECGSHFSLIRVSPSGGNNYIGQYGSLASALSQVPAGPRIFTRLLKDDFYVKEVHRTQGAL